MRVSLRYGFTFLCMPKCASTSIENALSKYSELMTRGRYATRLKHTRYRKYKRFIEPFIKDATKELPETVCVMREPIEWVHSWYRYRKRDEIIGKPESTKEMSFDEFCNAYMNSELNIGRQYDFLRNRKGEVGIDRVFRYERMDLLKEYFEKKIGQKIDFPSMNISPKEPLELNPEIRDRLLEYLSEEYRIYNTLD